MGVVGMRRALAAARGNRVFTGIAASVAAIAAVSGLVLLLRPFVPVFSLGALYVLAVLPAAVFWGRAHAVGAALASMVVFNFLFIPPELTLTLSGGENWLVLVIYLVTGVLVSDLAASARRRAREAEQREREAAFLAELSSVLLSGVAVESELARIAEATARLLELPGLRIGLEHVPRPEGIERAVGLVAGRGRVGTLYVPPDSELNMSAHVRFLPALASVLAIALDRERLAHEALEMEALRRSDALKTALLRTVSHDLRSPLTAIRASLEALGSHEISLDDEQRDALLGSALVEAERLDRTVRNLLDLSRLQAGAALPDPRLRTVDGLLDQALVHFPAASSRLQVSVPADLPLVRVDPIQVEHALVNLLENALKYSPSGSSVIVTVEPVAEEVIVRIADAGPGIAPGDHERIFEPFAHGTAVRGVRGTGLGLAIARGFLEVNGGRVWSAASDGKGACFCVALPTQAAPMLAAEA